METLGEIIVGIVLVTGLVGLGLLTHTPKKDGRTATGYKNNASPWAIKRRFIGAVLIGIALLLAQLLPDEDEPEADKPAEQVSSSDLHVS